MKPEQKIEMKCHTVRTDSSSLPLTHYSGVIDIHPTTVMVHVNHVHVTSCTIPYHLEFGTALVFWTLPIRRLKPFIVRKCN